MFENSLLEKGWRKKSLKWEKMFEKKVINEEPISLAEVRLILKKRAEEGELNYEQKITYDHVKEFGKSSVNKVKAAIEKFIELGIPKDIVDIQPTVKEELIPIFDKFKFDIESNAKKILAIVKDIWKKTMPLC